MPPSTVTRLPARSSDTTPVEAVQRQVGPGRVGDVVEAVARTEHAKLAGGTDRFLRVFDRDGRQQSFGAVGEVSRPVRPARLRFSVRRDNHFPALEPSPADVAACSTISLLQDRGARAASGGGGTSWPIHTVMPAPERASSNRCRRLSRTICVYWIPFPRPAGAGLAGDDNCGRDTPA